LLSVLFVFFFFQAEDGILDFHVTGVQTCALPISRCGAPSLLTLGLPRAPPSRQSCIETIEPALPKPAIASNPVVDRMERLRSEQIGRASCRERITISIEETRLLER